MKRITPEDWTSEVVARFWEYTSSHPHRNQFYFSRLAGHGLGLFLNLKGLLNGSLLDYGCGPGFLFDHLAGYPVECWGVDPSPASVVQANERCRSLPNFRGVLTAQEWETRPSRTFDVVTCVETIEHLPADAIPGLLARLKALVRPGGTLVLTTPHEESLMDGMIYCPFCCSEFHHMQHLQSFTTDRLTRLLTDHGFDVPFCQGIELRRFCYEAEGFLPDDAINRLRHQIGRFLRRYESSGRKIARLLASGPHLIALAKNRI